TFARRLPMRKRLILLCLIAVSLTAAGAGLSCAEDAKATAERDAVLSRLGRMVGGHWVSEGKMPDGSPVADLRFEWGPDRKSIRGSGKIAGIAMESRHAWDSAQSAVYYLDSHGPETIYFGHVRLDGDELVTDFRSIVGDAGAYRTRARWSDP